MDTVSIPSDFLSLVDKSSLEVKKAMLDFLKINIMESERNSHAKDSENIMSPTSYKDLVLQTEPFIDDEKYLYELGDELESLDLFSLKTSKPKTMSFALNSNECTHNGKFQAFHDLSKYPALSKLQKFVSSHKLINKELDFCKVICYSSDKKTIRLHADNEDYIDQTCPIATVSLGASRTVEFVLFGSSHRNTVISVESKHNSLYVMKPGCQSVLQHRVTPGNSKDQISNQVRYSISFRKFKADLLPSQPSPTASNNSQPSTSPKIRTTLIAGDSFVARLDANKLGKSRKNVINLAKGGNKIPDVINSIENFRHNCNTDILVDQIFISVGTNDIRNCRGEGVSRFKGELYRVVRYIKQIFIGPKYFSSR